MFFVLFLGIDLNEFNVEDKGSAAGDVGAGASVAVAEVAGNEEAVLGADRHKLQTFGPAFDYAAQGEGDRFAALVRAVEFRAVNERAGVVDFHSVGGFRLGAFAFFDDLLGVPMHHDEDEVRHSTPGVATGLAWTSVGGEILSIEVSLSRGAGHLSLTGNLGEVMKESATIAFEFIKAHSALLEVNPDVFDTWNVHVHVPEGATPKDGPSAGITMLAALTSAFTQRKVKGQLAMTGEITLRGKVLPVGGIQEKILAAKRNGVTDIILSVDNERDIKDIKEDYIQGLNFHYVKNMLEVIDLALEKEQDHNDLDYNKYLLNYRTEVIGFKGER